MTNLYGEVLIEAKRERILTLDLLRGYFLFVIVIDHINFFPSVFEVLTGRGQMWASAAEGFFIISGLLVGYIYGPRMVSSTRQAMLKIWKRAFLLYVLTVLLTWVFVWWGNHSDIAHLKEGLWVQPELGDFLVKTLSMQYYYGWADFLPYYAIFMFWAPLALLLCIKRLGWVVLVMSAGLWSIRGGSFELSWQLLFMSSLVAGWYWPRIEAWARSLLPRTKRFGAGAVYTLALTVLLMSMATVRVADDVVYSAFFGSLPHIWQGFFVWLDQARQFMTPLIDKWTLAPVRLATALLWFIALYIFVRQREQQFNWWTRGFFRTLGERSLVVYVTHAFVIFALLLITNGQRGLLANTLMDGLVVWLIYAVMYYWSSIVVWMRRALKSQRNQLQVNSEEVS